MGKQKKQLMPGELSTKTKVLFGLGDIYGGGGFQLIGFFYAIFLSDTLGLSMLYVPIVILIGKIWDACIDPMMGRFTDNAKSRWARRRPFFLVGAFTVVLSFMLLFAPVSSDSQVFLLVYALVSYLVFCTVWSLVMVPYFAFSAELTLDYNERTKLVTYRTVFSLIGSLLASALPMTIVGMYADPKQGYFVMATVFGIVFSIAVLCVFFSAKETPRPNVNPEKESFFKPFLGALKIRCFRTYIGMFIFGMMAVDIVSMIMAYYTRYYLRADGVLTLFLTVALLTELVFLPMWSFIARKRGKRAAYVGGAIIWIIMGTILFFIPPTMPIPLILAFIVLISSGMGAVMFIPHTILGDITDVGEFAHGKRQEGTFAGFASFIRQCSGGFAIAAVTGVLGLLGYITPPEGTTNFTTIYQPPVVEGAIKVFISIVPVVLVAIGLAFAIHYYVNRKDHDKMVAHLNNLREGGMGTLDPDEELRLRKLFISKKACMPEWEEKLEQLDKSEK